MAHVQYIQLHYNQNKSVLNTYAEMFDCNLLILILAWSEMLLFYGKFYCINNDIVSIYNL